jgi:hypothetical protein|tara:strand:- start:11 stop:244 length:234 start_codon:yes stop_codon:yes gene_type:complete
MVPASIGNAAFFAPEQEIEPDNLLPPIMRSFSNVKKSQMGFLSQDLKRELHQIEIALLNCSSLTYALQGWAALQNEN